MVGELVCGDQLAARRQDLERTWELATLEYAAPPARRAGAAWQWAPALRVLLVQKTSLPRPRLPGSASSILPVLLLYDGLDELGCEELLEHSLGISVGFDLVL